MTKIKEKWWHHGNDLTTPKKWIFYSPCLIDVSLSLKKARTGTFIRQGQTFMCSLFPPNSSNIHWSREKTQQHLSFLSRSHSPDLSDSMEELCLISALPFEDATVQWGKYKQISCEATPWKFGFPRLICFSQSHRSQHRVRHGNRSYLC